MIPAIGLIFSHRQEQQSLDAGLEPKSRRLATVDVSGLYADAMNSGADAYDLVEEAIRSAKRVRMQISGVYLDPATQRYSQSPACPIPSALFDLFGFALETGFGKIDAVYIERDPDSADDGWRRDVLMTREITEAVSALA